jgi:hypothetical protein
MMKLTQRVFTMGLVFAAACGSVDREFIDEPGEDAGAVDSVSVDSASADNTQRVDSAPVDAPTSDSRTTDVQPADAAIGDTPFRDSAPIDATTGDSAATDIRPADSALIDATITDSRTTDSALVDAVVTDTWTADSADADSADSEDGPASDGAPTDAVDGAVGRPVITVTLAGNGAGVVTSNPAGIDCGTTCTASFDYGQNVTLTATPGAASTFTGWTGSGCAGTAPCTVLATAASAVTATFTLDQHRLTVAKAGNGAGTVSSNPAGISCGATCFANFNYGQDVTLTAAPSSGSTFTGWSAGGCAGTAPCTVSMTAASTVTATFTLLQYTLSVGKSGTGTGTVSSNPAGIDCGATCSAVYNHGTIVSMFASSSTSAFMGWSGSCAGTGACSITMNSSRLVSANFVPPLTCTTVNTASTCTNGSSPEINRGPVAPALCHDQCQIAMRQAGMTTGCWIFASDGNCYCRSGSLNSGGTRAGGSCN